jgi:hypothetical protein
MLYVYVTKIEGRVNQNRKQDERYYQTVVGGWIKRNRVNERRKTSKADGNGA